MLPWEKFVSDGGGGRMSVSSTACLGPREVLHKNSDNKNPGLQKKKRGKCFLFSSKKKGWGKVVST